MPERSGRAVNGGREGRRERPAAWQGHPRPTEHAGNNARPFPASSQPSVNSRLLSAACAFSVADAFGRGCPSHVAGLWEQAQAWMPERSGRAVNGGREGRRERPAAWQGHPRPTEHAGNNARPFPASSQPSVNSRLLSAACAFSVADAFGRGCPSHVAGLWEQAQAWMPERSGRAVNGGREGRRERPAAWQGHPRPSQGATDRQTGPFSAVRDPACGFLGPWHNVGLDV
jgi:hypothetical protein